MLRMFISINRLKKKTLYRQWVWMAWKGHVCGGCVQRLISGECVPFLILIWNKFRAASAIRDAEAQCGGVAVNLT